VSTLQRQLAFYRFSQILYQMKTVCQLFGGRGPLARGLSVAPLRSLTVPTNRVDVRMSQQPFLDDLGGMFRQYVNHRSAFQVHYNGAKL
jgi:hypothetical protein